MHDVCVEIKLQLQVLIDDLSGQRTLSLALVPRQLDRSHGNSVQQLRQKFVSLAGVPRAAVPHLTGEVDVDWNCDDEDWRQREILLSRGERETLGTGG